MRTRSDCGQEIARRIQQGCREDWQQYPIRSLVIDDLFPISDALNMFSAFPPSSKMKVLNTIREWKLVSSQLDRFDSILEEATYAFQEPCVISALEALTGFQDLEPDPMLYVG